MNADTISRHALDVPQKALMAIDHGLMTVGVECAKWALQSADRLMSGVQSGEARQ